MLRPEMNRQKYRGERHMYRRNIPWKCKIQAGETVRNKDIRELTVTVIGCTAHHRERETEKDGLTTMGDGL